MRVRGYVALVLIRSGVHQADTPIGTANAVLGVLGHVVRTVSRKYSKRFHLHSSSNQTLGLMAPTNTGSQQPSDSVRLSGGSLVSTSPPGVTTMRTGPYGRTLRIA